MTEATRLKNVMLRFLEWQYLPTKFYENPLIGSKVISTGHTHTHTGDLISPLSFLESRLKMTLISLSLNIHLTIKITSKLQRILSK
jgi:hypothetical protein